MKRKDKYYSISNDKTLDLIYHKNVNTSYPIHTHAEHDTLGIVLDGAVFIESEAGNYICEKHNLFTIPMDMPHAVSSLGGGVYTMLTACIHRDYAVEQNVLEIGQEMENRLAELIGNAESAEEYIQLLRDGITLLAESRLQHLTRESCLKELKQELLGLPELPVTIEEMSKKVCVSPFHMIRQFKKEIGLTPHQFQIQCRIRKAQKLLLERKTITEVAFETGFCDQSHFDKSFKKLIGMSPAAYQKAACFAENRNKLNREQK